MGAYGQWGFSQILIRGRGRVTHGGEACGSLVKAALAASRGVRTGGDEVLAGLELLGQGDALVFGDSSLELGEVVGLLAMKGVTLIQARKKPVTATHLCK